MKLLFLILIGVITPLSCKGSEITDFSQLSEKAKFEAIEDIINQNKKLTKRLDRLESIVANLIQKVLLFLIPFIHTG